MKIDFSNSPNMSRAIECYKTNNFSEAISLFSEDEKRNNFEVIQFIGVCLFKIKKYPAALSYLEICINAEPSKCSKQAWLYYFNIYAMQDNVVLCKEILQQAKKYKKFDFRLAKTALDRFCDTDDTMALDIVNEMYPFVEEYCYKNQLKVPQRFSSAYARYHISLNSTYNKEKIEIPDEILNEFEILIPTYKRKDIVVSTIREMKNVNEKIHIRVIDNASDDGSFEALQELVKEFPNLYVSQNKENIGYSGSMLKLLQESKKKYIIFTSDEDPVIIKNAISSIDYMKDSKIDFLVPQFFRPNRFYRGKANNYKLPPQDYAKGSFYTSGIIFNSILLKNYLTLIQKHITRDQVYPEIIFAIVPAIFGNCSYYNLPVTYFSVMMHTYSHQDVEEGKYNCLIERWRQFQKFMTFFNDLKKITNDRLFQENITIAMKSSADNVFFGLKNAAKREFPDLFQ